jgi:hypothetical protein
MKPNGADRVGHFERVRFVPILGSASDANAQQRLKRGVESSGME